jgi:pyruvate dehydrogenase E2 component (dihydrolipoamide acetyltransferase)
MPIKVLMPKLGLTMTEGLLVTWLVADGAQVRRGQPIFQIETDKATVDAEAPGDGALHAAVQPGTTVPVNGLVGYLLGPGEAEPGMVDERGPVQVADGATPPSSAGPVSEGGQGGISPIARRMAREAGLDLAQIRGTGEGGRIRKEDIERAIAERQARVEVAPSAPEPATEEGELIPIRGVRALIAERMLASARQTAAVTLTAELDATHLVAMRSQLNEGLAERLSIRIAYHDILIFIAARALREFPYLNARQEGEAIRRLPNVHVGLAVDTERGLLVPVLRDADRKSPVQIARETREMIERALAGRSLADELTGGTFTLTNLGMYGVDSFTPIINPPELAILGVGRIEQKPAAHEGSVQLRHRMALCLTFDHRLVDGGPAARFLRRLVELIEKPYLMLADAGG